MYVIVTRHQALIEFLKEHGIEGEVIPHVIMPEQIKGKVVVGVIPIYLAPYAKYVITPVLELKPEDRGRELTLEEIKERFKGFRYFKVYEVDIPETAGGEENA